jgi:hypothetical protein
MDVTDLLLAHEHIEMNGRWHGQIFSASNHAGFSAR